MSSRRKKKIERKEHLSFSQFWQHGDFPAPGNMVSKNDCEEENKQTTTKPHTDLKEFINHFDVNGSNKFILIFLTSNPHN